MPTISREQFVAELAKLREAAERHDLVAADFYPDEDAIALLRLLAAAEDLRAQAKDRPQNYLAALNDWIDSSVFRGNQFNAPVFIPRVETGVSPAFEIATRVASEKGEEVSIFHERELEQVSVDRLARNRTFVTALDDLYAYGADGETLAALMFIKLKGECNTTIRDIGSNAFNELMAPRPNHVHVDREWMRRAVLDDQGVAALIGMAAMQRQAAQWSLTESFGPGNGVLEAMHALELIMFLRTSQIKLPKRQRLDEVRRVRKGVLQAVAKKDVGDIVYAAKEFVFTFPDLVPPLSRFNARLTPQEQAFFIELKGESVEAERKVLVPRPTRADNNQAGSELMREHARYIFFDQVHPDQLHWYINYAELDQTIYDNASRLVASVNQWAHVRLFVATDADGEPFVYRTALSSLMSKPDDAVDVVDEIGRQMVNESWKQVGPSKIKYADFVDYVPLVQLLGEDGLAKWTEFRELSGPRAKPVAGRPRAARADDMALFIEA